MAGCQEVQRPGVQGRVHRHNVDVAPDGKLSHNESFRDEKTGSIGVNFNRRDWPGNPDAGFYKPHSQLGVCPPGICPNDAEPAIRAVAASTCRTSVTVLLDKLEGRKITGGDVTFNGKTYTAKKNRKTGRWSVKLNLKNAKASKLKITKRIRTSAGRTVTKKATITRCPTKKAQTRKPTAEKRQT